MSTGNNTSVPLAADATFTGLAQLTTGFTNILISIKLDKRSELTIQQSANKVHWDLDSVWTCDPANDPSGFTIQTPVALPYFRVILHNTTAENMTVLRLVSVLNLTSNVKLTPQQDNTLVSGEDAEKKKRTLLTDASGALIMSNLVPFEVSGDVVVTSQPYLSYLTDNIAVATMPAITGTVAVSSQPPLSYLTDNIAVATMPAITGSVSVTSQPHLSYLTDNIAVATQPALAFATDKVDATGSTVITSHTTSSVVAWDNPTSLVSFDSGSSVRNIKTSAGSLHSLSITNDNNALAYVALYNELALNVTAGTTTPIAVFTINKNQQIQLPLHSVQFSTAISFFSATAYGGSIAQTAVYLTASYNG